MKIRWFIFIFLLTGAIYFLLTKFETHKVEKEEDGIDYLQEKLKPSDYWEEKWSYPSTESQSENFKLAIELAKKQGTLDNGNKSGLSSNWRMEGPTNIGGRANCLLIDSRDTNIIYVGMAAGGIFKTTDGGANWLPIADDFAYLSISQIIQDPLYPDTIYAATGDRNFGSWGRIGDGVKVSYDAGTTWQASGLDNAGIVSKLIIDPVNRILWASVLGNPRVSNLQRGVYKSVDMGQSWQLSHNINSTVGAIDLVMDPFEPQTLYVSYFNRKRTSVVNVAAGNDGRIWQTKNGGSSWAMLTNGLPNYSVSRIGLAVSAQTPGKIYATVVDSNYYHDGLYKSLDTGRTWVKEIAFGLPIDYTGGFGWYFGQVRANPFNDEDVWLLGVDMFTSTNGGNSFDQSVPSWFTYEVHADKHDLVFYDTNKVLLATDGGLYKGYRAPNGQLNWIDIDLIPNNQFYRVAINPHRNDVYGGGVQDNGTIEGTHTQLDSWRRIFGGDGFQLIYDPVDSNIFYCETQNGNLYAFDEANNYRSPNFDNGVSGGRNWDMPFIMSRFDRNTLYCFSDRIHRTTNGPYGSFNPVHFGALNTGISTISNNYGSALCESKIDSTLLYAGTGDGKVWKINPNTGNETDITSGLPNRYVTSLTTSTVDTGLVIVTHSGYLDFQTTPHIYLSTDFGSNWTAINGDLPPFALNDTEILDNTNDSVIFVASDAGVYVTTNAGVNWNRVGGNMPMIPVSDLAIDYKANRLIAGTFARSIQSFDLDSVLTIDALIVYELGKDTTICLGDTLELGTGLNFTNYKWSTGETTSTIKVFSPGLYWVESTTSTGIARGSITISVDSLISTLELRNDTSICEGSDIMLGSTISNFDSYLWSTGSTSKTIVVRDTGIYVLTAQNRCIMLTDSIHVSFLPPHPVVLKVEKINAQDNFYFKNSSAQTFSSQWFLNGDSISTLDSFNYKFQVPDTYTVTLESIDSNGCKTVDSLEIVITQSELFIPNIFTPNQDGINDSFLPVGDNIVNYSYTVYDKWGMKIVELENFPWDGRDGAGQITENGTYFFKIKIELNTKEVLVKSGTVSLIR